MNRARVLIAEDRVDVANGLRDVLVSDGYAVEIASNGDAAFERAARSAFDVVICSIHLGEMRNLHLVDQLNGLSPTPPVIVTADEATIGEATRAVERGAHQLVTVAAGPALLRGLVDEVTRGTTQPTTQRPATLASSDLVSASPAMQALLDTVTLVAQSNAPVLIHGESGSGKERVARAIHAQSLRNRRAFVAVNAAAIPEQLLESEMFGHVRGAFTGATQSRRGVFDEADGGTVLLDEIGDMPLPLQAKLLRVLQFGEVRPVGSERVHHVDVRVIAATHRDLAELVRVGSFRDDLRYRLDVLKLDVPPLRRRREDIPLLVEHFLQRARARTPGSPVRAVDSAAMTALLEAPWPGNVRELESTIERLVVLGREEVISPRHLAPAGSVPAVEPWSVDRHRLMTLREMNQSYLAWVLGQTDGDKVRAARILDIDLSTLYRWQRANK
jgi:two-component system response regulator HydG